MQVKPSGLPATRVSECHHVSCPQEHRIRKLKRRPSCSAGPFHRRTARDVGRPMCCHIMGSSDEIKDDLLNEKCSATISQGQTPELRVMHSAKHEFGAACRPYLICFKQIDTRSGALDFKLLEDTLGYKSSTSLLVALYVYSTSSSL
jgi:hypothetical protein